MLATRLTRLSAGAAVRRPARAAATVASAAREKEQREAGNAGDAWAAARPYDELPGPRPLPLLGNLLQFLPGGKMHGLDHLAMQRHLFNEYGPVVRLQLPGRADLLYLFDPEDVCKVFRNEGPMPTRDVTQSIYHYRTVTRPEFFEGVGGALVAQGEEWRSFRSKVSQVMMQPRSIRRYIDPINDVADDLMRRIHQLRDGRKELPADFKKELLKWGLEASVAVALDTRLGCLAGELAPDSEPQRMIDATQRIFVAMEAFQMKPFLWKYVSTPMWRQYVKDFDLMCTVAWKYTERGLRRLAAEREQSGEQSGETTSEGKERSVLEKMLLKEAPAVGAVLANDILVGGTETTSQSFASTLMMLSRHQEEQRALAEELHRVLGRNAEVPRLSTATLDRLPLLRAFIKETMRMTPVVPGVPRNLTTDLVLSGYQIPRGTEIIMGLLLIGRREEHVQRANEFLPERWIKGHGAHGSMHPFASLPFGFGPRMCIGRRFAELNLQVLTAKVVHKYQVEYHHGEMPYKQVFMYAPSGPLRFRFTERNTS